MSPSCPWSGLSPSPLAFCEERLCAWVVEPANAWSNISFVLVGTAIFFLASQGRRPFRRALGALTIALGIGSFFFHASATRLGEIVDVTLMDCLAAFAITLNASRLYGWSRRTQGLVWCLLGAFSLAIILAVPSLELHLFGVEVLVAAGFELAIRRRLRPVGSYRPLLYLGVVFGVAWVLWWLDFLKLVCDSTNHWVNGHAMWHVLGAAGVYVLYRFYSGIDRAEEAAA